MGFLYILRNSGSSFEYDQLQAVWQLLMVVVARDGYGCLFGGVGGINQTQLISSTLCR